MDPQYYNQLFEQLLNGRISPAQKQELFDWLGSEDAEPEAARLIRAQLERDVPEDAIRPEIVEMLEAKLPSILKRPAREEDTQVRRLPYYTKRLLPYAAAVVLLAGSFLLYRVYNRPAATPPAIAKATTQSPDIAPGQQGAILTLANGQKMVLDSMGNGYVVSQNGSKVLLQNGQLQYKTDKNASAAITYNQLSTPRGRQFRLVLPDGTEVWLNAASSIKYPTAFTGRERTVEVTGEAYFEVAQNVKQPFHVKVAGRTEIEVLGTHFNVNAYDNEATINTTLLEGGVRVHDGQDNVVIKPGQQAQSPMAISGEKKIKVLSDVNVEKVMAWKNGVFNFQDASLEEVMRQIERWYDIEVVYEKNVPQLVFVGKMGRDLSLSNVLRGLELSKVHFRLEGRKVIVLP